MLKWKTNAGFKKLQLPLHHNYNFTFYGFGIKMIVYFL